MVVRERKISKTRNPCRAPFLLDPLACLLVLPHEGASFWSLHSPRYFVVSPIFRWLCSDTHPRVFLSMVLVAHSTTSTTAPWRPAAFLLRSLSSPFPFQEEDCYLPWSSNLYPFVSLFDTPVLFWASCGPTKPLKKSHSENHWKHEDPALERCLLPRRRQ